MTTHHPNQRPIPTAITAALDGTRLRARSADDEISIAGTATEIDGLLDRLAPIAPIRDCDGQLHLFDPAPYLNLHSIDLEEIA